MCCLCCYYNLCCCCDFCNSFSSACIELTILIFSFTIFIFSLLDVIIIKMIHLKSTSFVLLILLIVFSTIITIDSISILIYRFKRLINGKRNSFCICLTRIGLIFTLFSFVISVLSESFIQSYFNDLDYPCKNKDEISNQHSSNKEFCKDKNSDYNAQICSKTEYTISYLSSTIIDFCTFISMFLWYNDLKRIKEKVDGNYGGLTYLSGSRMKKRIDINFKEINEPQMNEIDSVNKNINHNSINNYIIFVKNKNNINKNKIRMSSPTLNYKKVQNNFIKNLREEMKQGIESIEEEENSSKNKESQNQKISIYKGFNRQDNENGSESRNNDIKYSEKEENNTKVEDNKGSSIESPNIFL